MAESIRALVYAFLLVGAVCLWARWLGGALFEHYYGDQVRRMRKHFPHLYPEPEEEGFAALRRRGFAAWRRVLERRRKAP